LSSGRHYVRNGVGAKAPLEASVDALSM